MSTNLFSNHKILVIDDNRAIHADFQKIFSRSENSPLVETEAALFGDAPATKSELPFELESAYQGQEGLAMVQESLAKNCPYAMAFVDVRMPPGWDGIETVGRIWEVYPDLQVVICTAYSDYSLDDILSKLGHSDRLVILKKPFDSIEVLQLAHALTEKWQLLQQAKIKTGELERLVTERTHALQEANEKLKTEMEQRARVEDALRQTQKMEAIGRLAGGVAHDFNNILTVIRGYVGLLLQNKTFDARTGESLQQVDGAAQRAANLTRQLLTFSRKQVMQLENLELNEVIGQITKMLNRVLREDIALQIEPGENVPAIHADRAMMEQVILNLAVNARDAMPSGGKLIIHTAPVQFTEDDARQNPKIRAGHFAQITVSDTGCGIAPDVMPRLFEPFFTTKAVGKGTGLGLATVFGIVKQHEGWIEVESEPGHGATFKIFFPQTTQTAPHTPRATPMFRAVGGSETILLVEDEPALRNMAMKVLNHYGYRVLTAASGIEALSLWPEHGAAVDLLVTDMVMPDGVSGRDLAKKLCAEKSALKVIYSSGYSLELVGSSMPDEKFHFLPKPYTPENLARLVRGCLDSHLQPINPALAAANGSSMFGVKN